MLLALDRLLPYLDFFEVLGHMAHLTLRIQ